MCCEIHGSAMRLQLSTHPTCPPGAAPVSALCHILADITSSAPRPPLSVRKFAAAHPQTCVHSGAYAAIDRQEPTARACVCRATAVSTR